MLVYIKLDNIPKKVLSMSSSLKPQKQPPWTVKLTATVKRQKDALPEDIAASFLTLVMELAWEGPAQPEWRNYGKLGGQKKETHHCHLNTGKPRYVAVWQVTDKQIKLIEVKYAGTHQNAPY